MKRHVAISFIMLPLLFTGCKSTHPAKIGQRDKPYQEKAQVQWNSSRLKHVLRIEKRDVDRTEAGLMRIRLAFRNKTGDDVWVEVRTTFTDEEGFESEKTNWEPVCCTARTQTTYETVSLGAQVSDYQIIIREPKTFSWRP
jgi:hypothetical protein